MKMKWKITILCCLLALLFVCTFGVACSCSNKEEFSIKFIDYSERETLIINTEYDAMSLIEQDEKATYSIETVFYLDDGFNRVDVPFDGMKFTQTKPYDVSIIIGGTKGESTDRKLIELKINYQLEPIIQRYKESWCDSGVVKAYSAESEYLKDGAVTSMRVRYIGTANVVNNGITVGSISGKQAQKSYNVTDWSNAVIEMDVFNAHEKALEIGVLLFKKIEGEKYYLRKMFVELPANEWTHVAISLRAIGWAGDFIDEYSGYIDIVARQVETEESGNYNYTFYCCNANVNNYDPVRLQNLDTRTADEIKQEFFDTEASKISGTECEKKTAILLKDSENYTATTTTEYAKEGEASLKYTFTRSSIAAPSVQRGTFLNDQNGVLTDFNTVTDWNNVYLGLWAKNPSNYNVAVLPSFANSQDGKTFVGAKKFYFYGYKTDAGTQPHQSMKANTDWTYMEWSLNELYPTIFTEKVSTYRLSLATETTSPEGEALTFYIDDIKIFSKKPIDKDESNLVKTTEVSSVTQEVYNDNTANVKAGSSSIKVTYGGDAYSSAISVENGGIALLIPDNQQQGVYNTFSAYTEDTYKSETQKTYVGFWVKNATNKQLAVCLNMKLYYADSESTSGYGSYVYGAGALNQVSTGNGTTALVMSGTDTEWHYYEIELTDVPETFYSSYKIRMGIAATIVGASAGDTFYIDDFDIYHGSKKSAEDLESDALIAKLDAIETVLATGTTSHSVKHSINSDIDNVKVGTQSIKVYYDSTKTVANTYAVENGGLAFITENHYESVYDDFSAYDANNRTYAKDGATTYAGFWVKNTTGKTLKLQLNIKLYDANANGTFVCGGSSFGSTNGTTALTIDATDVSWHYYEVELTDLPTLNETGAIIRMGLAASIANVAENDAFYVDGFDIYHGSRMIG